MVELDLFGVDYRIQLHHIVLHSLHQWLKHLYQCLLLLPRIGLFLGFPAIAKDEVDIRVVKYLCELRDHEVALGSGHQLLGLGQSAVTVHTESRHETQQPLAHQTYRGQHAYVQLGQLLELGERLYVHYQQCLVRAVLSQLLQEIEAFLLLVHLIPVDFGFAQRIAAPQHHLVFRAFVQLTHGNSAPRACHLLLTVTLLGVDHQLKDQMQVGTLLIRPQNEVPGGKLRLRGVEQPFALVVLFP